MLTDSVVTYGSVKATEGDVAPTAFLEEEKKKKVWIFFGVFIYSSRKYLY
jgi:hypothetical protein